MINNHQPLLSCAFEHRRFKGCYVMVGFVAKIDSRQEAFFEITLQDGLDTLTVYCRDESCIDGLLQPNSAVHVELALDRQGTRDYFRCKYISPLKAK